MSTLMTTPTTEPTTGATGATGLSPTGRHENAAKPVPFTRIVRVELRKTVDTRAGLWLLIAIGLVGAAAMLATIVCGGAQNQSFVGLLQNASIPLFIILPVLGIMAATAEWSQRSSSERS